MSIDPDIELVRRCQSENPVEYERAFFELYKKYGEKAFNIAYRILGNGDDACDVTQDAFITLFKKIKSFRSNSRFFTWFYRIVVNLSIDSRRKRTSNQQVIQGEGNRIMANVPDEKGDAVEQLAWQEYLETHIQASLAKLNPNLRVVTVLRYIEGLSYAEVAETLECSIGTVKSRLNRAHKHLEGHLRPLLGHLAEKENTDSDDRVP